MTGAGSHLLPCGVWESIRLRLPGWVVSPLTSGAILPAPKVHSYNKPQQYMQLSQNLFPQKKFKEVMGKRLPFFLFSQK